MSEASVQAGTDATSLNEGETQSSDHAPEETQSSDHAPEETLPLDQVFGMLKNQRRRYVLQFLKDSDGEVSLSDVAEQIAAWENDKDIRQISSSERKRVYVGLYQCHLPKMDGMDIVEFNKPRGLIEIGENADALFEYLDTDNEHKVPPWHIYSLGLSLSGAVVLGIALLFGPMTNLPVVSVAVVFLIVAFATYSLININWITRN